MEQKTPMSNMAQAHGGSRRGRKSGSAKPRKNVLFMEKLSHILDNLMAMAKLSEDWLAPGDSPQFRAEVEGEVRALHALIERYRPTEPRGLRVFWQISENSLDAARKDLRSLARTGTRSEKRLPALAERALLGPDTGADFSAEAEELRMLRAREVTVRDLENRHQ